MSSKVVSLVVIVLATGGCGASAQLQAARSSAYQAEYDQLWNKVVTAVAVDFPVVKELDKENRRIVTCWRPIEREKMGSWFLFRAIVEISPEPPYRVSVSGRAAEYRPPQLYPIKHGDAMEPGWVDGRIDRVVVQVHDGLKDVAVEAADRAPPATDPGEPENVVETCVLRAGELGIASNKGMRGVAIGDPGALGDTPR